jgi:hypothetical protein
MVVPIKSDTPATQNPKAVLIPVNGSSVNTVVVDSERTLVVGAGSVVVGLKDDVVEVVVLLVVLGNVEVTVVDGSPVVLVVDIEAVVVVVAVVDGSSPVVVVVVGLL